MMSSKQDPVYKRLCKVFEQSGLAQHFPNYKISLFNVIESAYAKNIESTKWQGMWSGDKFHKYMAKCALDEFLSQQLYTCNPLLTKDIVNGPGKHIVSAKDDNLYVRGRVFAAFGKQIDITPVWLQNIYSVKALESQCA